LDLVLLVLDVEVIEDLLLFCLSVVGVAVLSIKLAFPEVDFCIFLLDQFDEVLILFHEVRVLSEQQLDLLLQVINLLVLAHLEHQFLVQRHQLALQLTGL
jgi:hypothetical protein